MTLESIHGALHLCHRVVEVGPKAEAAAIRATAYHRSNRVGLVERFAERDDGRFITLAEVPEIPAADDHRDLLSSLMSISMFHFM
jgi:hypothetical protein